MGLANWLTVLRILLIPVFITLLVEFRSFLAPLAIVWGSLLSLAGVGLALWITDTSLNIVSFLGAIIGLGIVAAMRQNTWIDYVATTLAMMTVSTPGRPVSVQESMVRFAIDPGEND